MSTQNEIRQRVTDQIVTALEAGGIPRGKRCVRRHQLRPADEYRQRAAVQRDQPLCLSLTAAANGWSSRYWGTFKQWSDLKCSVRPRPAHVQPGRYGTKIVFMRPVERTAKDKNGDECEERFWVLKNCTVFNAQQVEGAAAERLASVNSEPRFETSLPPRT